MRFAGGCDRSKPLFVANTTLRPRCCTKRHNNWSCAEDIRWIPFAGIRSQKLMCQDRVRTASGNKCQKSSLSKPGYAAELSILCTSGPSYHFIPAYCVKCAEAVPLMMHDTRSSRQNISRRVVRFLFSSVHSGMGTAQRN